MRIQSKNSTREQQEVAVACILVNYRSPRDMLEQCLASLFIECPVTSGTVATGIKLSVLLVDNASGDGIAKALQQQFSGVTVIEMAANSGFASAVNHGLAEIDEPLVLLLNPDAVLVPGALWTMVDALMGAGPDVAGVAPKMMSSSHKRIIDAVGTVMPPDGAAFNRGIGQCDLGQYDQPEEVAGVCFGAALLRRELFETRAVGPLYEDYFLYFEDSDWCMRATSEGYTFVTVPEAVVLHMHSGVTRNESLAFKYRLIELNTLKIVTRTFASPWRVWYVAVTRCARLLARTFIRRRFIRANLSTIASYLLALPRLHKERRELGARRRISDRKIFDMARGENAWFDTVAYRPDRCLDSLIDTYERLLRQQKDPVCGKFLALLYRMRQENAAGHQLFLDETAIALIAAEPVCVRKLMAGIEA